MNNKSLGHEKDVSLFQMALMTLTGLNNMVSKWTPPISPHTLFTNPINMVSTLNESLNATEDIKVTKVANFIINLIINPILLIKLSMCKVFFFSPILELINTSNNYWSLVHSTQTSSWPKHLNFTLWSSLDIFNIFCSHNPLQLLA